MAEKSGRAYVTPATDLPVRPGDFVLGSWKSRAAARALIQRRYQPIPSPWGTLNLSYLTVERVQTIYEKISALPGGQMIGTPWFPIRWPDGFKPGNQPISAPE